jgi:hypothetical protein
MLGSLEAIMPLAVVLFLVDATLVIHAAKTGRFWPWAYVILLLPGFGALGYVIVELLPEVMGTTGARKARRQLARSFNPEQDYRRLSEQLEVADTIANRQALADECLALGRFDEAKHHYEVILAKPLGDDPIYCVRKARAEFGLEAWQQAVATLDDLRRRWPDYQSGEAHLLYARALEAGGRTQEALDEYQALSAYYPGAEPRVRRALLLKALGRGAEARGLFAEVVKQLRRAPRHARRLQAEWIAIAERESRA